ncbi:MAG: BlaI/MecI/CopY family transcriptional regulator [Odoribacter splanchnicus]
MNKMEELTRAELQIIHILWNIGKTYQYYPLVNREDYMERYMNSVVNNFFSGSVKVVVSFGFKTCHF